MRQLIIDTETTGLDPKQGHRIIEIAAVEVVDRRPTGRTLHFHLDPERDIDSGATEVHGMTWDDLQGQAEIRATSRPSSSTSRAARRGSSTTRRSTSASSIASSTCAELPRCADVYARLIDTLALARETFPGKRNNLDALCERFGVSNAHRTLHGALLDAQLLAEVYLAMTRGQETLTIDMGAARGAGVPARPSTAWRALRAGADRASRAVGRGDGRASRLPRGARPRIAGRCLWLPPRARSRGRVTRMPRCHGACNIATATLMDQSDRRRCPRCRSPSATAVPSRRRRMP